MKLFYILFFVAIFFLCSGCRKDKLDGDLSFLVGKWEWYHTFGTGNTDRPGAINHTPSSISETYQIELLEKGKFVMWKNGDLLNKGRITKAEENALSLDGNAFEESLVYWQLHEDTIYFHSWPFDASNTLNYFARMECP